MKNTKTTSSRTKLGNWKVQKQSETEVLLTLPTGMKVTGSNVTVDDLLSAIASHNALKKGRAVARCCSGNMAIV